MTDSQGYYIMCRLLTILLLFGAICVDAHTERCYDKTLDFYPMMGTRTPYHVIGGQLKAPKKSKCQALQIWGLIRHGTRYFKEREIKGLNLHHLNDIRDEIVKNHANGDGMMCKEDINQIKDWDFNTHVHPKDDMTDLGREELRSLGERLRKTFPEALEVDPKNLRPEDFLVLNQAKILIYGPLKLTPKFKADYYFINSTELTAVCRLGYLLSTNFSRTKTGIDLLKKGIFGEKINLQNMTNDAPLINEELLLPQLRCPAWERSKRPKGSDKERDAFANGPEMHSMLVELDKKLGYKGSLTFDKILPMYEMCRFEAAWYPNKTSTWCRVFSKDHIKYYEYKLDLNFYYCCGSGQEMAPKLGCKTLGNMFTHFENKKNNKTDEPRGIFYFGNTLTNQALMASLEIGRYPVFTGTSYATSENRTYRNSINSAFGTNLLGIFYRCEDETTATYKVQIQSAENVVHLNVTGCDEEGLCDWEEMKKHYKDAIDNCSMDFCFESSSADQIYKTFIAFYLVINLMWLIVF